LEDEIGFPLFWRSTGGIEVTEAGRTFLHEAERLVGDLLNLSEIARRLRGGGSETLSLGMISGTAQMFVPRLFDEFARKTTDIKLRIVVSSTRNIFRELQGERIDAGIAIEPSPDRIPAGLVFDRLATVGMALIVHPQHAFAKSKKPINVSTLATEPIIMNELEIGYGEIVQSLFADIGIRPNVLAIADNVETIKIIVQTGVGIAILPRASAEQEVSSAQLRALALLPECNVNLSIFRRREPLSQDKQAYLTALTAALRANSMFAKK